jgi:hypothetical protein
VEGGTFIRGLKSLEEAVGAFYYLCFVADLHYPEVNSIVKAFYTTGSVADPE